VNVETARTIVRSAGSDVDVLVSPAPGLDAVELAHPIFRAVFLFEPPTGYFVVDSVVDDKVGEARSGHLRLPHNKADIQLKRFGQVCMHAEAELCNVV
jgi:hypothetical protein